MTSSSVFLRLGVHDLTRALDALPPVAGPAEPQRLRATGTADVPPTKSAFRRAS